MRHIHLSCLLVLACGLTSAAEDDHETIETVLAGLEHREQAMPDLAVTLECIQQNREFDSDELATEWGYTLLVVNKADGRLWWDATGRKTLNPDGTIHMQPSHKRLAYDGSEVRTLHFDASGKPVHADIDPHVHWLGFDVRQLFRFAQSGQLWSEYLGTRSPRIAGKETREGIILTVVETAPITADNGDQWKSRLLIAPDWNHAVTERVQLRKPSGGGDWSRSSHISMSGFHQVADVWLPSRMEQTIGEREGWQLPVLKIEATVHEWHVGVDVSDRHFRLKFPPGIQVWDRRSSPAKTYTTPPLASESRTGDATQREPIYDEDMDVEAAVQSALAEARVGQKRVLLMFGGNWCGPCYRLHDAMRGDEAANRLLDSDYEELLVDIALLDQDERLAERYDRELIKKHGVPFLLVLDGEGQVIAKQHAQLLALEYGTGFDTAEIVHFLEKWSGSKEESEAALDDSPSDAD